MNDHFGSRMQPGAVSKPLIKKEDTTVFSQGSQVADTEIPMDDIEQPDSNTRISADASSQHRVSDRHSPTKDHAPQLEKPLLPCDVRVIALLAPASIFGLLARLGVHALATYDGQSVFAFAWVQAIGCFVMGLCLGWREIISASYPELYPALSSGFCGSVTTFSSWQLETFLAFSNRSKSPPFDRIWIYDIMDGLTQLIITLSISFSALICGIAFSTNTLPPFQSFLKRVRLDRPPTYLIRLLIAGLGLTCYILTIPLYFILTDHYRPMATSALPFAFPGALTRYLLSVFLNHRSKRIPPGTLTANILGTSVLALVYVLQRSHVSTRSNTTTCYMLIGLGDGYCGCLSTVSTFVVELRTLKYRKGLVYFLVSVILAQVVTVLIVGSAMWSKAIGVHQGCFRS
ncbi:hypothetical protein FRC03_004248 [Tulasnella sp. 419]|nr:hypothetical protein FRC03_004248 [Tulasnella sp. 419]